MADGEAVVIHEVESPSRELVLAGSDLPEQGVAVGAELRSVVTHYPGTGVASTQLMGTSEQDIVLRGRFNDILVGTSGWALLQTQRGRDLLLRQRPCELAWGETLVRRGWVKSFVPTFIREGEIEYELTFQVAEADEAEQVQLVENRAPEPSDAVRRIDDVFDVLDAVDQAAHTLKLAL